MNIEFNIDKSILETSKLTYKNIDDEDLKIIDELFNYLASNTIKYDDKDLRFLSVTIFIISKIINKPTYKILEDLNII